MVKRAAAEVQIPEIRFRPTAEVFAKAQLIADELGLTITDVARMGLAQISTAREIRLVPSGPQQQARDLPVHGVSVGRLADIAAAAALRADRTHVEAGRLEPSPAPAETGMLRSAVGADSKR
jgi:antitoxin component of RelBE/YafQ-DinJ toxin-antitoxin module